MYAKIRKKIKKILEKTGLFSVWTSLKDGRPDYASFTVDKIRVKDPYLYFGGLGKNEPQYQIPNFVGLSIYPCHDREIFHNASEKLPFADNTISKIQSQDVFEHLPFQQVPIIFDEIYRVLKVGGVFRLSVPDYRSPLLKKRSAYNYKGEIIADLMVGASVRYDDATGDLKVDFLTDGNAHVWFPTIEKIREAIGKSNIRLSSKICFYQYFESDDKYIVDPVPLNDMYVSRSYPHDERADGKPISIVVDFFK